MAEPLADIDIETLLAPIRCGDRAEPVAPSIASFHDWIRSTGSPELAEWNAALTRFEVRGGYHNAFFGATCPTLEQVLAVTDDGCRAARIRSVFLGTSAILQDAEELWLATWHPTAEGKSVVFASHQDERDLWLAAPSIAEFVLEQYVADPYFAKDLTLPESLAALPPPRTGASLPSTFDPVILAPRLDWIVALLFPEGDWYGLGTGLKTVATFGDFEGERGILLDGGAPHLLAYWLLHHLIFANQESLLALIPTGEESAYPAARALAEVARAGGYTAAWWDEPAIEVLRSNAQRTRPEVFEPQALAASAEAMRERRRIREGLLRALATRPMSAERMLWSACLEGVSLEAIDLEVLRDTAPEDADPDARTDEVLLAKRGNAPGVTVLFEQVARDVDDSWTALVDHQWQLLAAGERIGHTLSVAILMLAGQVPWSEVLSRCEPHAPWKDGRWARMALAAVALRDGSEEAMAFVRAEAKRFFDQLAASHTDTGALAAEALLRRHDGATITAVEQAFSRDQIDWRATRALLRVMGTDASFGAALEAIVVRGLGNFSKGEPVEYAVQLAKAAPGPRSSPKNAICRPRPANAPRSWQASSRLRL